MFIDSTRNYRKGVFTLVSLFLFVNVEFACTAEIPVYGGKPPYTVCNAETCVKISADIRNTLNTSFDPCDDFYHYVCDGWTKSHLEDGEANNRYNEWQITINNRIADIMKAPVRPTDNETMKKVKRIFQMCMSRLNSSGITDLKRFLNDLGGWPIITHPRAPRNNRRISWQVICIQITRYIESGPFYAIGTGLKFTERTKVIMIYPPLNIETDLNYMRRVINAILADDPRLKEEEFNRAIDQDIENVRNFAEQLKKIANLSGMTTLNITELQKKYDEENHRPDMAITQINWLRVVQRAYPMHTINTSEEITVGGKNYFKNLTRLLSETPERTIVNYVLWTFVRELLKFTSEDIRSIVGFPTEQRKRELKCIDEPNLNHAIQYEYMKVHSSHASKVFLRFDVDNIRNVLRQELRNARWMDEKTHYGADKFMSSVKLQIGGPEWYSDSNIDEYYTTFHVTPSYFYTALKVLNFDLHKSRSELRTPINITKTDNFDWFIISPLFVNAVYYSASNTITIPLGIADDFMYHMQRPPALNYGMLGSVAAHELHHACDGERKLYEMGGRNTLWTNDSVKAYQERTNCLIEQYNNYGIPEVKNASIKVNGRTTLSENIADSGLLTAFRAYKRLEHNQGRESRLVNLEQYTADQLFFISYATTRCRSISPKTAESEVQSGHAPSPVRLHGSISNMDEFGAAFNCPLGSRLNPVKKCKLWE